MPLRLEDLKPDAQVKGLIGLEAVRIVSTQWLHAWKNTNQIACITKNGNNEFELVTPAGSGKGSFVGNGYFSGVAGGRTVNCVGRSVTNTGIGVCSD